MTITTNPVPSLVDEPDADRLPGSTDVEWAERAYRHLPPQRREATPARRAGRPSRTRRRLAAGGLVLACIAAVIGVDQAQGSTPRTTHHATVPAKVASITPSAHQAITPPLLRPLHFPIEVLTPPRS